MINTFNIFTFSMYCNVYPSTSHYRRSITSNLPAVNSSILIKFKLSTRFFPKVIGNPCW